MMQYLVIDMSSSVDMTGACAASSRLMWSLFLPFNVILHRANGPANVIKIWFMEQGQNCCMLNKSQNCCVLNKSSGLKYRFVSSLLRLSFKIEQLKVMRMELQYF